jgi:hypothetical protein
MPLIKRCNWNLQTVFITFLYIPWFIKKRGKYYDNG